MDGEANRSGLGLCAAHQFPRIPAVAMRVPLNDARRQYVALAGEIQAAVRETLESGWYIMGREHDQFEIQWAAYCQCSFAVGLANGTDALEIALRAVGCREGDEVITAANAGGYATSACRILGAVPVYADIDRSLTVSPASVAEALGPRTKAVVVTHLYGKMADVEGVRAVLAGRDIPILEDCAQSHGAMRGGRRAGSLGALAAFSFYPTKNLGALGDGGAIVTDNADYARRARMLRQYGWAEKYHAALPGGRNSRLDELQAAILRRKLPHLDAWNERRRAIVGRYREAAAGTGLRLPHVPGPDFVAHLCVGRHARRDEVRRRLQERGIATAVHYPTPDHRQPAMAGQAWRAVGLAETEAAQGEILTLPCFPEMTPSEIDYVCDAIRVVC